MAYRSSVPLFWRLKKAKYSLIGSKCNTCGSLYFPPKNLCPKCRRKGDISDFKFSGNGIIESYTVIRTPPEGFEEYIPYAIAIIKLDEGPKIAGQIADDIEKVDIGKKVTAVFRKMYQDGTQGLIHYGIKWTLKES